ncbi:acyl carrier protein [Kitasatospora sp. NBC_00315]|uniref:acyl carrier protein n=1 Tax=Kitasatospora sp. NBC_00315 TaxID=2975963 RepID=UPI00324F9450
MTDHDTAGPAAADPRTTIAELRGALAELSAEACDGELSAAELLAVADSPFFAVGVGSLAQLRLLDAVESRYGVFFDLGGPTGFPESLDALVRYLAGELGLDETSVTTAGETV